MCQAPEICPTRSLHMYSEATTTFPKCWHPTPSATRTVRIVRYMRIRVCECRVLVSKTPMKQWATVSCSPWHAARAYMASRRNRGPYHRSCPSGQSPHPGITNCSLPRPRIRTFFTAYDQEYSTAGSRPSRDTLFPLGSSRGRKGNSKSVRTLEPLQRGL